MPRRSQLVLLLFAAALVSSLAAMILPEGQSQSQSAHDRDSHRQKAAPHSRSREDMKRVTKLSVNIRHKRRSNRDIDERWLIVDKSFHFVFPCDNPAAWYKVENDTKDHRLLIVRKDALEYPNVCSEENSETLALTIKNVNKTCAGEYECRDPTTPVDVKVRLHIQIKGEELDTAKVDRVVLAQQERKRVCCKARSSYFTHPGWYKFNGHKQLVGANRKASLYSADGYSKGRCLRFKQAKVEHSGTYVCEAIHGIYGWTERLKTLSVTVTGPTTDPPTAITTASYTSPAENTTTSTTSIPSTNPGAGMTGIPPKDCN